MIDFGNDDFSNQLASFKNDLGNMPNQGANGNGGTAPSVYYGQPTFNPRKRLLNNPYQEPAAAYNRGWPNNNNYMHGGYQGPPWEAQQSNRGYDGLQQRPPGAGGYSGNSFSWDGSGYAFGQSYPGPPNAKRGLLNPNHFNYGGPRGYWGPNNPQDYEYWMGGQGGMDYNGSGGNLNMPPIPPNAKEDVFSPYYGVEQLPEIEEDTVEEPQEPIIKIEPELYPANSYRPIDADQQQDEDVNSLMRDAQIIAGLKPDEEVPISDETLQKAQEIEITVPSELMLPEHCQLCGSTFTSGPMAKSHYEGKKHAQKENQYIRKIYEEKGINVTRFLNKPKTKRTAVPEPKRAATKSLKKYKFTCNICSMCFESRAQVELHITHVSHRKKVFDNQTELFNTQMPGHYGRNRPMQKRKVTVAPGMADKEVGEYFCNVCNKVLNSKQQYDAHIVSKKHLSKQEDNDDW